MKNFKRLMMYRNYWDKLIKQKKAEKIVTIEWDWNDSLGDTIMEKYESLYIQVNEIVKKLMEERPEFMLAGCEIASVFETATACHIPSAESVEDRAIAHSGTNTSLKVDIFSSKLMPGNQIFFFTKNQIYRLVAKNFVI